MEEIIKSKFNLVGEFKKITMNTYQVGEDIVKLKWLGYEGSTGGVEVRINGYFEGVIIINTLRIEKHTKGRQSDIRYKEYKRRMEKYKHERCNSKWHWECVKHERSKKGYTWRCIK